MQVRYPNRLAELIETKGVKLVHVGAAVDKDQSTVYRWSKGLSAIPDDKKAVLADYFGVTRAYLMGWDEDAPTPSEDVAA